VLASNSARSSNLPNPFSHLLFDLDGTLTDPKIGIVNSLQWAFAKLDRPIDKSSDLNWCIGPPMHDSMLRLLGPGREHLLPKCIELYREQYAQRGLYENSLYPGVPEMLSGLRSSGARLLLCTSKPWVFAAEVLKHFSLDTFFDQLYGSELDGTRSDKGELIGHLLKKEHLNPDFAVMIGDRMHDMVGASRNRVIPWGVSWGYGSTEELQEAGAARIFDHPLEITPDKLQLTR
jgi:phosphoglycolate phosphatase